MSKKTTRTAVAGSGIVAMALLGALAHAESIHYADLNSLDIRADDAASIALSAVAGDVIEAELEWEDDRAIWEIEIVNSNNQVLCVEIDGKTGQVLSTETSDDAAPALSEVVSLNKAIEIVQAVENGALIEMELEEEDGELVWEIETLAEGDRHSEFRVHGLTGEIL